MLGKILPKIGLRTIHLYKIPTFIANYEVRSTFKDLPPVSTCHTKPHPVTIFHSPRAPSALFFPTCLYDHLARSAPTILDDSLSADAYLNVLYMPSTFPRSERSRRALESASSNSIYSPDFEDGPRSNLDSLRYLECVNYLQEYARQHLLTFMFRHGHYNDGCMLFFPTNAVPPPPQPSNHGVVTSSSSPQRQDLLATDYGSIDDLCDMCIGYGAMSVLEEVISTRMLSTNLQDVAVNQYTAAALARICTYCETHKHFNYLYQFQNGEKMIHSHA
ncbi:hypothetical protein CK203_072978 [Vitis vinifera]|uniref:Uncharacterized protein n=1 Tax=Vitis vinifera TaxID=29760 RepID=A0A438F208_VITVI|nr:hypothetical protein CK203_072978 [Vitis vinifera]